LKSAPMSLLPPRHAERGFTLVEVILATALVAVIAALVFGSLHLTTTAIDRTREQAARDQVLRSTLRLMAEELSVGVTSPMAPWLGINAQQEGYPADSVAFLALGQFRGAEAERDTELVRIVYTRERDRLLRFVRRNLYGLTDDSVDQMELATNVKGFNIRYYDAQANVWSDDWDARGRSTTPIAVLIELTLKEDEVNTEPRTIRQWVSVGVRS
jgi:general secretion pathway protein J